MFSFTMKKQKPTTDIVEALESKNRLEMFLSSQRDINFVFGEPYYCTLLHLACSIGAKREVVELLLKKGADRNLINDYNKDYPVHAIFNRDDLGDEKRRELLKTLMTVAGETTGSENKSLDLSVRDEMGNTALLLAVEKSAVGCVEELATVTDPNALNWNYESALHILLRSLDKSSPDYETKKKPVEDIILQLKTFNIPLKLPDKPDRFGETVADLIDKLSDPALETILDGLVPERDVRWEHLLSSVDRCEDEELILSKLDDVKRDGARSRESAALLILSCKRGMERVVEKLIRTEEVNPNTTINGEHKKDNPGGDTAVMVAASNGYLNILKILFESEGVPTIDVSPVNDSSILHRVIKGSPLNKKDRERDHYECLKYLLSEERKDCLNYINDKDVLGNTALHCAATIGDAQMVSLLLEKGADATKRNSSGESALALIPPEIMEKCLNRCVETNKKQPTDVDYEIILNHKFLTEHSDRSGQPLWNHDLEFLICMNEIDKMSHLFKHPIITSFLYVKWKKIKFRFIFYFICYLLLCIGYLCYSFSDVKPESRQNTTSSQNETGEIPKIGGIPNDCALQTPKSWIARVLFLIILIPTFIYFMVVFYWIVISVKHHTIFSRSDFIPIMLVKLCSLLATLVSLGFSLTSYCFKKKVASTAILLNSVHLVIIIGMFPRLSTYLLMSIIVATNFIKFLFYYSSIIISITIMFSIWFNKSEPNDSYLNSLGTSLFKIVLMMPGEFDLEHVLLNSVCSRAVFLLFVFVITMVLYNILNGLAVTDVQRIKLDAELFAYKFQTSKMSYLEDILFMFKHERARKKEQLYYKSFSDPNSSWYSKIIIKPNENCSAKMLYKELNCRKGLSFPCFSYNATSNPESQVNGHELKQVSSEKPETKESQNKTHCYTFKMRRKIVQSAESIIMEREKKTFTDDDVIKILKELDEIREILNKMRSTKVRTI